MYSVRCKRLQVEKIFDSSVHIMKILYLIIYVSVVMCSWKEFESGEFVCYVKFAVPRLVPCSVSM